MIRTFLARWCSRDGREISAPPVSRIALALKSAQAGLKRDQARLAARVEKLATQERETRETARGLQKTVSAIRTRLGSRTKCSGAPPPATTCTC
jgi:hypothetical protein